MSWTQSVVTPPTVGCPGRVSWALLFGTWTFRDVQNFSGRGLYFSGRGLLLQRVSWTLLFGTFKRTILFGRRWNGARRNFRGATRSAHDENIESESIVKTSPVGQHRHFWPWRCWPTGEVFSHGTGLIITPQKFHRRFLEMIHVPPQCLYTQTGIGVALHTNM